MPTVRTFKITIAGPPIPVAGAAIAVIGIVTPSIVGIVSTRIIAIVSSRIIAIIITIITAISVVAIIPTVVIGINTAGGGSHHYDESTSQN
jgi:hypothetical protein